MPEGSGSEKASEFALPILTPICRFFRRFSLHAICSGDSIDFKAGKDRAAHNPEAVRFKSHPRNQKNPRTCSEDIFLPRHFSLFTFHFSLPTRNFFGGNR